jgi:hypothetical protein
MVNAFDLHILGKPMVFVDPGIGLNWLVVNLMRLAG